MLLSTPPGPQLGFCDGEGGIISRVEGTILVGGTGAYFGYHPPENFYIRGSETLFSALVMR